MKYSYDQPWYTYPPALQQKLADALRPVSEMQRKRMFTPVPGRPSGGGPGIDHSQIKHEIQSAAKDVIDQWNKENP